jgi:hypothetical protein
VKEFAWNELIQLESFENRTGQRFVLNDWDTMELGQLFDFFSDQVGTFGD